jgi:hypothetical protein
MVVDEHEAKHTATGIGHSLTIRARSLSMCAEGESPP